MQKKKYNKKLNQFESPWILYSIILKYIWYRAVRIVLPATADWLVSNVRWNRYKNCREDCRYVQLRRNEPFSKDKKRKTLRPECDKTVLAILVLLLLCFLCNDIYGFTTRDKIDNAMALYIVYTYQTWTNSIIIIRASRRSVAIRINTINVETIFYSQHWTVLTNIIRVVYTR